MQAFANDTTSPATRPRRPFSTLLYRATRQSLELRYTRSYASSVCGMWDGSYPLTIITDASYTMQGLPEGEEDKHIKGINADLWKVLYDEPA